MALYSSRLNNIHCSTIGAIVDTRNRVGKEAKVAMEMAISDFNRDTNQNLVLHVRNSRGEPIRAALADAQKAQSRATYNLCYLYLTDMAIPLFHTANKMNLMGNNEFWIATSSITDLLHSLNATVISSMQGIVGVRSYYPESGPQFQVFRKSFHRRFNMENPEEEKYEPGIFVVQAYDATWVLAAALDGTNMNGKQLIEKVLKVDYKGLSGKFNFTERKLAAARLFEIVNGVRQTCSGFWSDGLGFSENIGDDNANYVSSIQKLEQDFCSMEQWNTRRRQTLSTRTNIPLRVGVPSNSCFKQFVNTDNKDYYTGFSIEVFREIMRGLPNLK
ncbi:hypothetical protein RJ639_039855 [Escallonia herrerae]|uniref:Receptor ligand binding region domain-containing protein n=1 Tax=Escallonia herrerae TaxID=1293975 RepID=A0AA89BAQ8_9ASTE|nr:hypothetical protein RJ639_039855 [Escallonia herrerae]